MKKKLFIFFILLSPFSYAQKSDVDTENLKKLITFCDSTKADEIWINYKGNLIKQWRNETCDSLSFGTASMVKSWVGILVGVLIEKGIIGDVSDEVCTYIPEWKDGCRGNVSIENLLTMTAGLNRRGPAGVLSKNDNNAYVLGLKLDTLPNIRFSYSNESVQLLGIIIERATKTSLKEAFDNYLLNPLGITGTTFTKDSVGNYIAYGGCITSMEAAMKIGQLMLDKGVYRGVRIVSEQWIKSSTTPGKLATYYGYLWWIDKNSKNWNYAATGDLGQMTIVIPELNVVFIRRQNCDLSTSSINMSWMGPEFLELISSAFIK